MNLPSRSALTCTLIVGLYYLVPVEPGVTDAQVAIRVAATVVVGLLISWLIVCQVSRQIADRRRGGVLCANAAQRRRRDRALPADTALPRRVRAGSTH
jgi:hypothetical protein